MKLPFLAIATAMLTLVSCVDSTAPLPDSGVPTALELSIGGFSVGGSSVVMRGDTVLFWRVPWAPVPGAKIDTVRAVPTAETWRAFWTAANEAGVSRWRSKYVAEGIVDGLGWNVRIVVGGREISSYGSNAYPDRSGKSHEGDSTPEFRAFIGAFDQLVGQKVFF